MIIKSAEEHGTAVKKKVFNKIINHRHWIEMNRIRFIGGGGISGIWITKMNGICIG